MKNFLENNWNIHCLKKYMLLNTKIHIQDLIDLSVFQKIIQNQQGEQEIEKYETLGTLNPKMSSQRDERRKVHGLAKGMKLKTKWFRGVCAWEWRCACECVYAHVPCWLLSCRIGGRLGYGGAAGALTCWVRCSPGNRSYLSLYKKQLDIRFPSHVCKRPRIRSLANWARG